jgi:hypothetical protein
MISRDFARKRRTTFFGNIADFFIKTGNIQQLMHQIKTANGPGKSKELAQSACAP